MRHVSYVLSYSFLLYSTMSAQESPQCADYLLPRKEGQRYVTKTQQVGDFVEPSQAVQFAFSVKTSTCSLRVSTTIIECNGEVLRSFFVRQVAKYGAKPDLVSLYSKAAVKAFEPSGATSGEISYEQSLAQVRTIYSTLHMITHVTPGTSTTCRARQFSS